MHVFTFLCAVLILTHHLLFHLYSINFQSNKKFHKFSFIIESNNANMEVQWAVPVTTKIRYWTNIFSSHSKAVKHYKSTSNKAQNRTIASSQQLHSHHHYLISLWKIKLYSSQLISNVNLNFMWENWCLMIKINPRIYVQHPIRWKFDYRVRGIFSKLLYVPSLFF